MQIAPPSDFVIWIQKRASCGLQKTPKSVIGRGLCPEPRWGSWRDEAPPDLPVGCGRVTPPHTPSHAAPTHLRRSPCVPPEFQPQLRLCWQLCYTVIAIYQTQNRKNHSLQYTGFPLYFDIKIQGLSRTLKLHFQGPILDGSLQHGQ